MKSAIPQHIREAIEKDVLSVEVTTRCNSACGHCFARAGREMTNEMSLETARAVACEGRTLGYRNLHITGGEPLMWPHLFNFAEEVVSMGYESVFINSNGTLLTAERAKGLAGFGGRVTLSISLQGPQELHDRVRSGSYRAAIAGLERALAAGIGVNIFTTVGKSLLFLLPRFAEFLFATYPAIKELTLIQLIRVHKDVFDLSADLLSPEDFISMVRMTALMNLYGYRVTVLQNPLATVVSRAMSMPWVAPALPLHRVGGVIVMADGSISLAHSTRVSFGLYKDGILEKALASGEYGSAVGPDDTTCGTCGFFKLCREHGMVRPSEWYRSADESGLFCRNVLSIVEKSGGQSKIPAPED